MLRILGIDPGSRITGYGIIQWSTSLGLSYVASGCIRTEGLVHAERLKQIFEGVQTVIQNYGPSEAAIEQIFMYRNPSAALKLGQARGAALTALALSGLKVAEYAPCLVKQSVVGYGAAEKGQVQHMVRARLALSGIPQADAADALAIALCHSQHLALSLRIRETQ